MYLAVPPVEFGEETTNPSLGHFLRLGEKLKTRSYSAIYSAFLFFLFQSVAQVLRDEDCPSMIIPSRPCEWFYFLHTS